MRGTSAFQPPAILFSGILCRISKSRINLFCFLKLVAIKMIARDVIKKLRKCMNGYYVMVTLLRRVVYSIKKKLAKIAVQAFFPELSSLENFNSSQVIEPFRSDMLLYKISQLNNFPQYFFLEANLKLMELSLISVRGGGFMGGGGGGLVDASFSLRDSTPFELF